MLFRFRKFQTRLLFFLVLLLLSLQLAIYISVRTANIQHAKVEISDNLKVGAGVFNRILTERTQNLFQYARLLSADYAFKPAFHSGDHPTILSAMENHLARLEGAQLMTLVDLDNNVIAKTLAPLQTNIKFVWPELIKQAEQNEYAEATSIEMIGDTPYQMIVVPYFSPDISAWVIIGFAIDQSVADDIKSVIQSEVSFLTHTKSNDWKISSTTLPMTTEDYQNQIKHLITQTIFDKKHSLGSIQYGEDELITFVQPIDKKLKVTALLQRSLNKALAPYLKLQATLQTLFWITLILSIALVIALARKVTKPVKELTKSAKNIESGNYTARININLKDEIGELADSFNKMAKGLEEKEKVRNLLGKVVSSEIAEELLSKDIELGGEEKEATILFSDIRQFTTLCEGYSAKEILNVLNIYLTSMSEAIENNKGVIDKYIGDAIMALFGIPLSNNTDANQSVSAAMSMIENLKKLTEKSQLGQLNFQMGIGINTGLVVAGNMGSPNRLNYTVIGDAVNLASRLEGLTKYYGVNIIVSESTRNRATNWEFLELDKVIVKGKAEPIIIFQPIATKGQLSEQQTLQLELNRKILFHYRNREWDKAKEVIEQIKLYDDSKFGQIYQKRVDSFLNTPPPNNWDFSNKFDTK
ncbi:adenylate/guanylate cyclase domain-containing protein [Pleionea sediminis]|uniref:adenylate/guanylate cyclase domain-containing protein n=1 Tax=Pleionea sediminis TaxID=2569479 RepID=UPI0011870992|nr:adenylate/guanylate cyclase domain-containing protein [Pleionea sediminis]